MQSNLKYTQPDDTTSLPLGVARFLSWISLFLILACNILLSVLITNQAKDTMLQKQKDFALLTAESVNYQIYRRYSIPLSLGGKALVYQDRPQFEPLEQVINSAMQGAKIAYVRIYGYNSTVTFSTLPSELGKKDIAPPQIAKVRNTDKPDFEIVSKIPAWRSMFSLYPAPESYMLRVTFPLNTQNRLLSFEGDGPKLDVLEFSQDITSDYESIIRFQWSILGMAVVSSLILFALLQVFIKRAEKALQERMYEKELLEKELHQSEKLASMGRVVSSIAHEIRNPLGIIRSSAELVLRRQKKEDECNPNANNNSTALIEAIHDEACRLSTTITDFLDYARPKVLSCQPVELNTIVDQALIFLGNSLAENNIQTKKDMPAEVLVSGDKDLLYRAIYNIVANSAQALNQNGEITVRAQINEDNVMLDITDNGPGFSEEALQKALDPFFTTKDGGTGLGLAIVQSIIISHKGTITLSNQQEEGAPLGAKVQIVIPRYKAKA